MKALKLFALVLSAVVSVSASAVESQKRTVFVGDKEFAGFCKAVVENDLALFKRSLAKKVGLVGVTRDAVKAKILADNNVTCAGQDLASFAKRRNATNIIAYIKDEQVNVKTAEVVKFVGDTEFAGFCRAAVNDDPVLFERSLKSQVGVIGFDKQDVLNIILDEAKVTCAGKGLVEFSQERNAKELVSYLSGVQA